jgi:predicted ABC-type ATPase
MTPIFYLLAGPNGAGKSSLYKAACLDGLIPAAAEFVNADLYEAANLQDMDDPEERSEAARQWADARRAHLIAQRNSFVSETVFSHESKLALIAQAQSAGFKVVLLVVCVDDPRILLARVAQRVSEGGHDVPAQRILARYPRTLANLQQAVQLADMAMLFHPNMKPGQNVLPDRVAVCRKGQITRQAAKLPKWAKQVLGLSVRTVKNKH